MNNKDVANEWFEYARHDFESAKYLLNMKPKPFEIICYHFQQSVEKYLKGFIALNGGEVIKTHDLGMLNKECCKHDESFKLIENECIDLTDYGVQVRYPFHIDLEESDVTEALKNTERVIEFLKDKIS